MHDQQDTTDSNQIDSPAGDASAAPAQGPEPLDRNKRRVLGVLIEKAFCTPEYYPLTANALVAGCNQKSNRFPQMQLEVHEVDEILFELQDAKMITRVLPASGRTERFRHNLKDFWQLDRPQRAVLAELLLRGPQTEGELRTRASRMVPVESLDALQGILNSLAQRGFVRRLSAEERKRGVIWTHLLYLPAELARLEQELASKETAATPSARAEQALRPAMPSPELAERIDRLENELQQARSQITQLQQDVHQLTTANADLAEQLRSLRSELGG